MRKLVTSFTAVGLAAVALTIGTAVPASAALPADANCTPFSRDDARVGIYCQYVNSGEVRAYAVCAGVDSNIATPWVGAGARDYTVWSDYKCRWGVRDFYLEERG